MAMNVFGNPITKSTLQGMVEYQQKKEITRLDLARVALNMKNSRGNDFNVCKYVENIGKDMREEPSTLCVLYNATGGTMSFVSCKNWDKGHLAGTPFPATIANGQWGGFVHINPWGVSLESRASVVYRGKNVWGETKDIVISWQNPHNREDHHNRVWTEIHNEGHYNEGSLGIINDYLTKPPVGFLVHRCSSAGFFSSISMGDVRKCAFLEAIFTLEHADDEDADETRREDQSNKEKIRVAYY